MAELLADANRLGFGEPVAISAETGEGMADLYLALQPAMDSLVNARRRAVQSLQVGWSGAGGLGGCQCLQGARSLRVGQKVEEGGSA